MKEKKCEEKNKKKKRRKAKRRISGVSCLFKATTKPSSSATLNSLFFLSLCHAPVPPLSLEDYKNYPLAAIRNGVEIKSHEPRRTRGSGIAALAVRTRAAKEDKEAAETSGKREYVSSGCNFKSNCAALSTSLLPTSVSVSWPWDRRKRMGAGSESAAGWRFRKRMLCPEGHWNYDAWAACTGNCSQENEIRQGSNEFRDTFVWCYQRNEIED